MVDVLDSIINPDVSILGNKGLPILKMEKKEPKKARSNPYIKINCPFVSSNKCLCKKYNEKDMQQKIKESLQKTNFYSFAVVYCEKRRVLKGKKVVFQTEVEAIKKNVYTHQDCYRIFSIAL